MQKKNRGPVIISFISTVFILSMVQWKVERPMLMAERFWQGAGWIEILILGFYASFLVYKMKDPAQTALWRSRSWMLFSIIFFGQLILGLTIDKIFLMTGKLHFPIPAMIVAGPAYRWELSFMPILFLSTVVLSGPAWCSQLCYFGALDNLAAGKTGSNKAVRKINAYKFPVLALVVMSAIIIRLFNIDILYAIIGASAIGIIGVLIIIFISPRKKKMTHCIAYCPVGTLLNYLKFISPFRMVIKNDCINCMLCTPKCKYDALKPEDIKNRKPGITCTFCGDCLPSCKDDFIQYKFFRMKPQNARTLYLIVTITIHAVFMGLARM